MSTTTEIKKDVFPMQAVKSALLDELMSAAETEASLHGNALPSSPTAALIAPVQIDSLVVVELLCAVEPVLGFAPSDATVRAGGYNSVQDALGHLMPRLEGHWQKQKGVSA